jgi:hypothetical protein
MCRALCLLVFSFWAHQAMPQDALRYELGVAGGFLMPHHEDMLYLIDGHVTGLEGALHIGTDGSKPWHHAFNFPTWGFALSHYQLASEHLGSSTSLLSFLDLPLGPKRKLSLMMGIGAGYVTRPFDLETNFHNGAIGSHLNASLMLTAFRKWELSKRLYLRTGIGIRHLSNGAMKAPNTGINLAVLSVSLLYLAKAEAIPERQRQVIAEKPWQFYAGTSGGIKEVSPIGGPKYGVINVFGLAQKRINDKSSWGAELGLNHNSSLATRAGELGREPRQGESLRAFAAAQYLLHFGIVSLRLQAGSYVLPKFKDDGLIFFRYHLVYEMERLQIFVGLKSHFAKADSPELGIAYRIK